MIINITKVKTFLWFFVILFTALSFPIQVYVKSPYPALIPYGIILLIIMMTFFQSIKIRFNHKSNITFMIMIYVFLILINTCWQTVFGLISLFQGISGLVNYLLPVVFYFYFRSEASEKEIRTVLLAIVIAGLICSVFFVYDSILKLVYDRVSRYAYEAFQYSVERLGDGQSPEKMNFARVATGSRSFGLLEKHSISGAYVCLGAFAALALLPRNRKIYRLIVVLIFGSVLLLSLNLTSIIAFLIIVFLIEAGGLQTVSLRISRQTMRNIVLFPFIGALLIVLILLLSSDSMREFMGRYFAHQFGFSHEISNPDIRMGNLIIRYSTNYIQHIMHFPLSLLIGDGFSSFGMQKGGDVGLIESLARLGLPFFIAIIYGYFRLIRSGLRKVKASSFQKGQWQESMSLQNIIQFSICITLLVFIMDCHYTIWGSKAILPIIFFTLALFDRYLNTINPTPVVKSSSN